MSLFAGVSETNITPPPDVWMAGYAARTGPAIGTHDDLFARALTIDNGHDRLVIIVADLIALDDDLVELARFAIAAQLDTSVAAVLIHCTHTHSGPYVKSFTGAGERDQDYVRILVRKLTCVARQAFDRMRPAHLTYGESSVQIGVNRRRLDRQGKAVSGADIAGPVAPIVQALCVNGSDGRMFAQLFSHACHPTTLQADNRLLSADWPGAAVTHLRSRFRSEANDSGVEETALAFCLLGCCGDIDPVGRNGWTDMLENGRLVADAAHTARWNAHGRLDDSLTTAEVTIDLPLRSPEAGSGITDGSRTSENASRPFRIQRLTLGGIHILGFPAEMFVQYQTDFSLQSSSPVFSLSYANGCHGYLPTGAECAVGGYEVEEAHRYYGTRSYAPECEHLVREAVYRLLGVEDADQTPYPLLHGHPK